jgi:hypothetical protein
MSTPARPHHRNGAIWHERGENSAAPNDAEYLRLAAIFGLRLCARRSTSYVLGCMALIGLICHGRPSPAGQGAARAFITICTARADVAGPPVVACCRIGGA